VEPRATLVREGHGPTGHARPPPGETRRGREAAAAAGTSGYSPGSAGRRRLDLGLLEPIVRSKMVRSESLSDARKNSPPVRCAMFLKPFVDPTSTGRVF
jgi:hypothetical protein